MTIMTTTNESRFSDDAAARIESIRATRGFILPHHGLMAICDMPLLKAYDAFYTELALKPRALSEHDKEIVWMACLIACEEAIPVHHIRNLRRAGGTDAEILDVARLVAVLDGARAWRFVERGFQQHLNGYSREKEYLGQIAQARTQASIGDRMSTLAILAACVCQASWSEYEWHLREAYGFGIPEPEIAEAISYAMYPGDAANYFYPACQIWRRLLREGTCKGTPDFLMWAHVPDHDPTAA